MAALPYMPLYVADYLADAAHLSTTGHGAYLLLIMTYWQRGEPLPDDERKLARIARMTEAEWQDVRDDVSEFFNVREGEWFHSRIERELDKVRSKSSAASRAGKASAERRSNGRSTDVEQTLNHTDTDTDTEREETLANANDAADAPPLSPVDEVWVHCLPELVALSGKAEGTVRKWIGKGLSKHSPEALRDAIRAAVAAKTGDPFAYVTRVLIPDPQARGSPPRIDCAAASDNLVKRLSDDTFAQPVARPMLTAVRG